ncbi:MAG TPA: PHP domain-containing protein, partial [Euzebya sp.]|nr:PHP domain-containing protein [Euzebya sp.]
MGDFAHLHVHTEYSMLDGASRVGHLMESVAKMGMRSCAMTDHGVMFGAIDFHQAGRKHGINPIIGVELYLAPHSRRNTTELTVEGKRYYHLTVLAENQVGYRNLMKLTSRAYTEGYWYKPRVDRELLAEHSEGLVVLSGCLGGEVNQKLLAGNHADAKATVGWYHEVFGDRYFVELQDHDIPEQHRTNGDLIGLAKAQDVGLVVTNDSHYTEQSDYDAHDALLCVQTGALRTDADRFKFHND